MSRDEEDGIGEEEETVFDILIPLMSDIADIYPIKPDPSEVDVFMLTFHDEINESIEWKFPDEVVNFKKNKEGYPIIKEMGDIFPYFVALNKELKKNGYDELDGRLYHITDYGSFYFGK